jgi:hypothetical protein
MATNLRTKKETSSVPSPKIVSKCSKDVSCDTKTTDKDCSVENWLKALRTNFFDSLVVAAAAVPGQESLLRKTTKAGDWKGSVITLLESIISRIPGITSYTVLEAETPEDAKELVRSGKAVLDITPTALSSLLPTDLSYLPISDDVGDNLTAAWLGDVADNNESCGPNTVVVKFAMDEYKSLSFIDKLNKYLDDNPNYIDFYVNSKAQEQYVLNNITKDAIYNIKIETLSFKYVNPPNSSEEMQALLESAPQSNKCDAIYLGAFLPFDCASKADRQSLINENNNTLDVAVVYQSVPLSQEDSVVGRGWAISSWAVRWQIWLQFALDSVVKAGEFPSLNLKKDKSKKLKDTCYDEDDDEYACCLQLSAPQPLYGFCTGFLPLVNVGERLLETPKCITPHPVVQNGAGCGHIKW